MKWLRIGVAALIVVWATAVAVLMPPGREPLALTSAVPIGLRGAVHVHTRRSDGTGTLDEVATAAARAGLRFVIVTDHGDGTRTPERPAYRDGVLLIDAVEISTEGGHVVALGLDRAPYPLGGDARDVVEDIARLGGMSIAAHPGSPKAELQWTEWTAPFDGLEWLNGDSEWRDESRPTLLKALLTYPFRPVETLGRLLDRPDLVMQRWDALTRERRVVALAAGDVHARLGPGSATDPYAGTAVLRMPSYERVFSALSIAIPQLRLSSNPEVDAAQVLGEIRQGHVFSAIDALATPAAVSFRATSGANSAAGGDVLPLDGDVAIRVASNAPGGSTVTLLRDGAPVATSTTATLEYTGRPEPAVYRAEIALDRAPGSPPVPWVVTNPIYVGRSAEATVASGRGATREYAIVYEDGPASTWHIEKSPASEAALDVAGAEGGTQLRLRYALGGTREDGPYTAFATSPGSNLANYDRITFSGRSDRPMRVSVQFRAPRGTAGERWHRSVYLDQTSRDVTVFFDEMTPVGPTTTRRPELTSVDTVLWVVGPPNTLAGSSGQIWLDHVRLER